MGIWDKFFGKSKAKKPQNSPFLPKEDDPLEVGFAKNFTRKGGKFLFNESYSNVLDNFKDICIENDWEPGQILCLSANLSGQFGTSLISQNSIISKEYKAAIIECEYLISNTGKILLSEFQIKHFKINNLPQTIIVIANLNQLVRDVSQGMTFLKKKYPEKIPTNITTLKIKSNSHGEKEAHESETTSKSIYLLLEDK
tara:strand:- start:357 stop:950 length:594 start_codon:yes stop_codon:yes gene_type:complete